MYNVVKKIVVDISTDHSLLSVLATRSHDVRLNFGRGQTGKIISTKWTTINLFHLAYTNRIMEGNWGVGRMNKSLYLEHRDAM